MKGNTTTLPPNYPVALVLGQTLSYNTLEKTSDEFNCNELEDFHLIEIHEEDDWATVLL